MPGGERYSLSCEYLRVHSPSAEVLGHGPGQEVLQTGKINVGITALKPVGNYALQLVFDDGHDTGLYSWRYLYELCQGQEAKWQDYLDRLTRGRGWSRPRCANPEPARLAVRTHNMVSHPDRAHASGYNAPFPEPRVEAP